jgi:hypothetical protein
VYNCAGRCDSQAVEKNKAGMMINTADLSQKFYDPMEGFRELAMKGMLSNKEVQIVNINI